MPLNSGILNTRLLLCIGRTSCSFLLLRYRLLVQTVHLFPPFVPDIACSRKMIYFGFGGLTAVCPCLRSRRYRSVIERISSLPELYPEHDRPGVCIAFTHIRYQLSSLWRMLVRVVTRPVTGLPAIAAFCHIFFATGRHIGGWFCIGSPLLLRRVYPIRSESLTVRYIFVTVFMTNGRPSFNWC